MLDDLKLFIILCHFFNDANASMSSTINFFLNQSNNGVLAKFNIAFLTCFCFITWMTQKPVEASMKYKRGTTLSELAAAGKSQELALSIITL